MCVFFCLFFVLSFVRNSAVSQIRAIDFIHGNSLFKEVPVQTYLNKAFLVKNLEFFHFTEITHLILRSEKRNY